MNRKATTINDVARQAGVSKRTVSRVINHSDKVNEQTRLRVLQVIEELNFAPNRQARGLAARRSYLLGLVYDVPTLFIADVQKGILDVCADCGFELVVHACHFDDENMVREVLQFVERTNVDGIIVPSHVSSMDALFEALDRKGTWYVRFSSERSTEPWKQVVTDYLPAITDLTNHLVGLGHRRFGFISGPPDSIASRKRYEAFVQALGRHGLELPGTMVEEGAFTFESGLAAAEKLLTRTDRPTAIFAANDEMAFAVMNIAHRMGLAIPDDLSLVGFDGTSFASFVIPALSTVRRTTREMARLGARKLIAQVNEGVDAARAFETMISPQFIPRDSTGPAPGS